MSTMREYGYGLMSFNKFLHEAHPGIFVPTQSYFGNEWVGVNINEVELNLQKVLVDICPREGATKWYVIRTRYAKIINEHTDLATLPFCYARKLAILKCMPVGTVLKSIGVRVTETGFLVEHRANPNKKKEEKHEPEKLT